MIIYDVKYGIYYIQYTVKYSHRFGKLVIIRNETQTCLQRIVVRKIIYLERGLVSLSIALIKLIK